MRILDTAELAPSPAPATSPPAILPPGQHPSRRNPAHAPGESTRAPPTRISAPNKPRPASERGVLRGAPFALRDSH